MERRREQLKFKTTEDYHEQRDKFVRCLVREIFGSSSPVELLLGKTVVFDDWAESIFLRPICQKPPLPTEDIITDPFSGYGFWRTIGNKELSTICANEVLKVCQLYYFDEHVHGNYRSNHMDLSLENYGIIEDEASSDPNERCPNGLWETFSAAEYGATLCAMDPFDHYCCWHLVDVLQMEPDWRIYYSKPNRNIRDKLQIFYLGHEAGDSTEVEDFLEEEVCDNISLCANC